MGAGAAFAWAEAAETNWHPAAGSRARRDERSRGGGGCRCCCCLLKLPGFDGKMLHLLTCDDRMGTGKERRRGQRRSAKQQRYINTIAHQLISTLIYSTSFTSSCSHTSHRHPFTNDITHSVNTHTLIHFSRSIPTDSRTNTFPVRTKAVGHFPLTTPAFIHPDSSFQEPNPLTLDKS